MLRYIWYSIDRSDISDWINHGGRGKEMQGMTNEQMRTLLEAIILIVKKAESSNEVLTALEKLKEQH